MDNDELKAGLQMCCKELRLSQRVADRAMVTDAGSHQEYLYEVLMAEVKCRRESRLSAKMETAGFPRRFELEDFDSSEVVLEPGLTVNDLAGLGFYGKKENIIMYGHSGTGKTMLSSILGIRLVRSGNSVRFFRTNTLIKQLFAKKEEGKLEQFLGPLRKVNAIILDEFGYVPPENEAGAMLLFDFISEIHDNASIILNTNLEFSKWDMVFHEKRVTEAFISRVTENSHILLFQGRNHQFKASPLEGSQG